MKNHPGTCRGALLYQWCTAVQGLVRRGGLDLADDGGLFVALDHDLIRDLTPMDLDVTREIKGDTNTLALDACDADNADRVLGVPDDDFFTFSACDDQHPLLAPNYGIRLVPVGGVYHLQVVEQENIES